MVQVAHHRDEAHDAGLAVATLRPVDLQPVEEQSRVFEGAIGPDVVEPVHGLRTLAQQTVHVVAALLGDVLHGAGHVQEAVGVCLR